MQRLLQRFAILLFLALPLFAAQQFANRSERDAFSTLQDADQQRQEALAAHEAKSDDADLKLAYEEAKATYSEALNAARKLRDESGQGNGGELGLALYKISGDGMDLSSQGAFNMVAQWKDNAQTWLVEEGPGLAINGLLALLILFVFRLLSRLAGKIAARAMSTSKLKVSDLLKSFFAGIVQKLIFFVGVMIALEQVGVSTGPLLAGMGVIGFVIGFALQDTLSNFASGIMILLYRPYDIGDFIGAAGESGSVVEMTLVSTTLTTPDNQKLILPNSAIWGAPFETLQPRTHAAWTW